MGPHQLVGNRHQLAEHLRGWFGDTDIVAKRLGHFSLPVQADENRHGQHHLRGLAVFALNIAPNQQIKLLLGGAEFDVGLERYRVVGLQ